MVESSGRRWEEQGVVTTVLRMWALRFGYWVGVSPDRLWEHYYGKHALRQSTHRSGEVQEGAQSPANSAGESAVARKEAGDRES